MFELNVNLAFGEHEWLNLEAFKQIPPESEKTPNAFVLNIPGKGLKEHEHLLCEL